MANSGLPQFITLPAQWQITSQLSRAQVVGDTSPAGRTVFRGDSNRESTTQLGGSIAWSKNDWQLHASFAYAQKERHLGDSSASSNGATDPSVAVVKEIPVGRFGHRLWTFARHIFPAADSIYDDSTALSTSAMGSGRPQTGVGALYLWNARSWDAQILVDAHLGHATTRSEVKLGAQPGGSLGAGAGWVKKKWRLGGMLTARLEGASVVEQNDRKSYTGRIQVWDSLLSVGRQLTAFQNIGLSYTDQTLVGPARNTTLTRTLALLWQLRW